MNEIKPIAMKIGAAAKALGLCENEVRRLSDLGVIPCRKLGRSRYFVASELERWAKSREQWSEYGHTEEEERKVDHRFSIAEVSRQ